jgi:very-short-patch-repair endonuclease
MFDADIADIASRQWGLFSRAQARSLGGTDAMLQHRVTRGRLVRAHPGVYSFPSWPESWRRRLWCAHLDAGPQSAVSHEAAAALHGLLNFPPGPVHLLTPHGDHHRGPRPNYLHQSRDFGPDHVTRIDGLSVTTLARTFCDLAATARRGRLTRALEDAHLTRRCSIASVLALATELNRPGKRGLGWLIKTLEDRGPGRAVPESALEARLVKVLRQGGFKDLRLQHELPWRPHVPDRVDVLVNGRIIVEADSRRWHGRVDSMADDRRRDRDAQIHGYPLYRFLYEEVMHEPDVVCETLNEAVAVLAASKAQPKPNPTPPSARLRAA